MIATSFPGFSELMTRLGARFLKSDRWTGERGTAPSDTRHRHRRDGGIRKGHHRPRAGPRAYECGPSRHRRLRHRRRRAGRCGQGPAPPGWGVSDAGAGHRLLCRISDQRRGSFRTSGAFDSAAVVRGRAAGRSRSLRRCRGELASRAALRELQVLDLQRTLAGWPRRRHRRTRHRHRDRAGGDGEAVRDRQHCRTCAPPPAGSPAERIRRRRGLRDVLADTPPARRPRRGPRRRPHEARPGRHLAGYHRFDYRAAAVAAALYRRGGARSPMGEILDLNTRRTAWTGCGRISGVGARPPDTTGWPVTLEELENLNRMARTAKAGRRAATITADETLSLRSSAATISPRCSTSSLKTRPRLHGRHRRPGPGRRHREGLRHHRRRSEDRRSHPHQGIRR